MLDKDVALRFYCENREHLRHHESERTTTLNIFLSAIAALYAIYISSPANTPLKSKIIILSIALVLSIYGAITVEKLSERANLHIDRSHKIQLELAKSDDSTAFILALIKESDAEHRKESPVISRIHLHHLWRFTFLVTFLVTTVLLFQTWRA